MKNEKNTLQRLAPLLILAGGAFWGSSGIFVKGLTAAGLDSITTAGVRLSTAGLVLLLGMFIFDRKKLKMPLSALPIVLATALCSVFAMSLLYFYAITATSLSVAAILLYTAPVFVMILSCIFFREHFTVRKVIALILAISGCVLVAGLGGRFTAGGILAGLGSGLAYASYSIFGKFMLRKIHPFTATVYTFLFAGLFALPLANFSAIANVFTSGNIGSILYALLIGLVTAAVPYILYTTGLKYMEAGRAAILATSEPLVASIFGIFIFREPVTFFKIAGILLIASAILVLNFHAGRRRTEQP